MADNVLREFLVKLGFKIEGDKKFVDTIEDTTKQVAKLGAGMALSATGIVAGVAKIASGFETLYYNAQRAGTTSENFQAVGQAIAKLGGSAEDAQASLTSIGDKLRYIPNFKGLFTQLGIATEDENGKLRDSSDLLSEFIKVSKTMPQSKALSYANALGVNESTLLAGQRNIEAIDKAKAKSVALYAALGTTFDKADKGSADFLNNLRDAGNTTLAVLQTVGAKLQTNFGAQIEKLTANIVTHAPQIGEIISKVAEVVIAAAEKITSMITTAIDIFDKLKTHFEKMSPASRELIMWIGAIGLAIKVLSTGIGATPIGRLLILATALLAVYDSYKQWKAGSKDGFINWEKWGPMFESFLNGLQTIGNWIDKITDMFGEWKGAAEVFLVFLGGAFFLGITSLFGSLAASLGGLLLTGITSAMTGLGSMLAGLLGTAGPWGAALLAAAALGALIGTAIHKGIEGTKASAVIGSGVGSIMEFFGSEDAKQARLNEEMSAKMKPLQERGEVVLKAMSQAKKIGDTVAEEAARTELRGIQAQQQAIVAAHSAQAEKAQPTEKKPATPQVEKPKKQWQVGPPGQSVEGFQKDVEENPYGDNKYPSAKNAKPDEKQNMAMQFFEGKGWTHDQAAGIVANLNRESSMSENAVGDSGQAYGLAQWHPDRQANFKKKFGKDIKGSSQEEQWDFVNHELTSGTEQGAGQRLKMAQNAAQAGSTISAYYERPAEREKQMMERGDAATRLANNTQPIQQTNTITINGATDPAGTGKQVQVAMNTSNENMIRNMRPKVF